MDRRGNTRLPRAQGRLPRTSHPRTQEDIPHHTVPKHQGRNELRRVRTSEREVKRRGGEGCEVEERLSKSSSRRESEFAKGTAVPWGSLNFNVGQGTSTISHARTHLCPPSPPPLLLPSSSAKHQDEHSVPEEVEEVPHVHVLHVACALDDVSEGVDLGGEFGVPAALPDVFHSAKSG